VQFITKINKSGNPTVIADEAMSITNGMSEKYLDHDNVKHNTLEVWSEPGKNGTRIMNYVLTNPEATPWKSLLRVYSEVNPVYITYESYGDQVEAEDINNLQQVINEVSAKVGTFIFTQIAPAATWPISHMLGKRPSVTVVDSGGTVVVGDVAYVSDDDIVVRFQAPFAGTAYIN